MMGERLLHSKGTLFKEVYDDRLLLKGTSAARAAFSSEQAPYEGAKAVLLVNIENQSATAGVIVGMIPELRNSKKAHGAAS